METREQAAHLVAAGDIVAYLTDTFYALGANPFDSSAIEKVVTLKGRDENKPILVVISDLKVADKFLAKRSANFELLVEQFWPGELTIIERAKSCLHGNLTSASGAIGLRLPKSPEVCRLVRECGGALTATSANPAGRPPAASAHQVASYFPSGLGLIVDGGNAKQTEPSTVVDVSGDTPRLIREGVISRQHLARVIELGS